MKLEKVRKLLEAMQTIFSRGEHFSWSGLTHIAKESGMSRQTVWRYLQKLEKENMVYKIERTYRGEKAYRYYMTNDGKKLLASFRKLPNMGEQNEN